MECGFYLRKGIGIKGSNLIGSTTCMGIKLGGVLSYPCGKIIIEIC